MMHAPPRITILIKVNSRKHFYRVDKLFMPFRFFFLFFTLTCKIVKNNFPLLDFILRFYTKIIVPNLDRYGRIIRGNIMISAEEKKFHQNLKKEKIIVDDFARLQNSNSKNKFKITTRNIFHY